MCADAYTHCHLWNVWHDHRRHALTRHEGVWHEDGVQASGWRFAVGEYLFIVLGHLQQRFASYGLHRKNMVLCCLHFFC